MRVRFSFLVIWQSFPLILLSCLSDADTCRQISDFFPLSSNRLLKPNTRIVGKHFASQTRRNCRKAKLHFQITFSLSPTSSFLVLSSYWLLTPCKNCQAYSALKLVMIVMYVYEGTWRMGNLNDHCDYTRENHFNKLLCAFIASHFFSMMWAKYITGLIRKGLR